MWIFAVMRAGYNLKSIDSADFYAEPVLIKCSITNAVTQRSLHLLDLSLVWRNHGDPSSPIDQGEIVFHNFVDNTCNQVCLILVAARRLVSDPVVLLAVHIKEAEWVEWGAPRAQCIPALHSVSILQQPSVKVLRRKLGDLPMHSVPEEEHGTVGDTAGHRTQHVTKARTSRTAHSRTAQGA
jgi:hypothetical protein